MFLKVPTLREPNRNLVVLVDIEVQSFVIGAWLTILDVNTNVDHPLIHYIGKNAKEFETYGRFVSQND